MRLSTDLEHLGRKEESLQVAERGVDDPDIRGGNRMALQRRVVRLGKPPRRWKRPSYADSLERRCREVCLYVAFLYVSSENELSAAYKQSHNPLLWLGGRSRFVAGL